MPDVRRLLADAAPPPRAALDGDALVNRVHRRQRRRQRAFTATAGLLLIALISTGAVLWTTGRNDGAPVIAIGNRSEAPSSAPDPEPLERITLGPVAMWRATTPQEGAGRAITGTLTYEAPCGFVLVAGDERTAVVWPAGTTVASGDGPAVLLPDGTRAAVGDVLRGQGRDVPDGSPVHADCPGATHVVDVRATDLSVDASVATGVPLAAGEGWVLAITADQELQIRQSTMSTSGIGDYTRPITLDEAESLAVPDGGFLFAGPVPEGAIAVRVTTTDGEMTDATVLPAAGLTWFHVRIPNTVGVAAAVALDEAGTIVAERSRPADQPMPTGPGTADGMDPSGGPTALGSLGDHQNCNFGTDPPGPAACRDPATGQVYCISGLTPLPGGQTIPCDGSGVTTEQIDAASTSE